VVRSLSLLDLLTNENFTVIRIKILCESLQQQELLDLKGNPKPDYYTHLTMFY
jgi:hypothetical protein